MASRCDARRTVVVARARFFVNCERSDATHLPAQGKNGLRRCARKDGDGWATECASRPHSRGAGQFTRVQVWPPQNTPPNAQP